MKKLLLVVGVLIFLSALGENLMAQFSKVGTAGALFLKIATDPKGIGMGEAYTALSNDIFAIYWNPAGLALMDRPEIAFSDVEWFAGVRNNFIGYSRPKIFMGTMAVSISALTSSQEAVTTEEQPEGTGDKWSYTAIACGISYARMMTDKFAFGINVKYLQERIWDISAQGAATDMGIYFNPGYWKSLRFGFVVKNFGLSDMAFSGGHLIDKWLEEGTPSGISPTEIQQMSTPYLLPLCLTLGAAYDIVNQSTNRLTAALDISNPNDGSEKLHVGIEEELMKLLALRLGYTYDSDATIDRENNMERWCGGIGINNLLKSQNLSADYAVQDMGRLGLGHRLAVNIKL